MDTVESLFKKLAKARTCEELELSINRSVLQTTRFARSAIHQNIEDAHVKAVIRAKTKSRIGLAAADSLALPDLKRALKKAEQSQVPLPREKVPRLSRHPVPELPCTDSEVLNLTPKQKASLLMKLFRKGKRFSIEYAGAFITGFIQLELYNTHGLAAVHPITIAQLSCVAERDSHTGYGIAHGFRFSDLNPEAVFERATRKASFKGKIKILKPGPFSVVLEPQAVADLLSWLAFMAFSGKAVVEGTSFMTNNFGRKLFDSKLTLYDDGLSLDGFPIPFDGEGTKRERVELIEKGVVRNAVFDSVTARLAKKKNTGHALPADAIDAGPVPLNLFMEAGDQSIDELISSVERGLLITRFHYINGFLNPPKALLTGLTRHGTFLIERGKIKAPVHNFRFTDSFIRAFSQIRGISKTRELIPLSDWNLLGTCLVPAVCLEKLHLTDLAKSC